ncbi:MAG: lipoprotein signal peptidase [Betaproteobacteria bacterium]|jgi:signal peptidase II|nr:lipoprotein signal peptidase [Betaproteobacteria bacterium]NDD01318.1 lipoprotein signal peptidase [Betaproteobacteria bacterium]NDD24400.1 lipoprotein signal peptidase [Betaproteobacteria bacterium]NDE24843.1 lipoprotein signal peptidase [Betaproteobacteria bacterium]
MAKNKSAFTSGSGVWRWLGVALIILMLDQLTKIAVVGAFQLGETMPITSFFNLVRVHNPGAAFSFLADAGGWQRWFFTGLGVLAAGVMVYLLRMHAGQTLFCLALSLLLGGAVGNVIDRLLYSYVIDFLDFYYGTWHFPAFNVADSAITVGAGLLILDELLRVRRGK